MVATMVDDHFIKPRLYQKGQLCGTKGGKHASKRFDINLILQIKHSTSVGKEFQTKYRIGYIGYIG